MRITEYKFEIKTRPAFRDDDSEHVAFFTLSTWQHRTRYHLERAAYAWASQFLNDNWMENAVCDVYCGKTRICTAYGPERD